MNDYAFSALHRVATLCFEAPHGEQNFDWGSCTYVTTVWKSWEFILPVALTLVLAGTAWLQYRNERKKKSRRK